MVKIPPPLALVDTPNTLELPFNPEASLLDAVLSTFSYFFLSTSP